MIKIAVMSGKGGVGKSSISILLSTIMAERRRTLLLDFDLCGPSIVAGLNVRGEVYKAEKGLIPIQITENLYALSMASLIKETDSVIWRGPKKISTLSMFYDSIDGFDCVVIDTPPGLSEEHRFLAEKGICALIVTTPQNISLSDASKAINFCLTNGLPVVGILENMSGYRCECCKNVNNIFEAKGGKMLAKEFGVPFVCKLEVDPSFGELLDSGDFIRHYRSLDIYLKLKKAISGIIHG